QDHPCPSDDVGGGGRGCARCTRRGHSHLAGRVRAAATGRQKAECKRQNFSAAVRARGGASAFCLLPFALFFRALVFQRPARSDLSTPVVMPQMGESIAEGTIVRWSKKVGDAVDRDEPLFEISTDKVDAEIPSPAAGTLLEISVKEGETVPVNSVVAQIGAASEAPAAGAP